MPSLNLDLDFVDHPKIKRLIARTGFEGVVCLLRLWGHAGKFHKIDGSLASYTDDEIEQFAGWSGMRGVLLQALHDVKLLDPDKHIHDWLDHAGHLAAYQAKAKMMAQKRWESAAQSSRSASEDTPSNPPSNASSNASSVQLNSDQSKSSTVSGAPNPCASHRKAIKPTNVSDTDHKQAIDFWCTEYEKHFAHQYRFDGSRDGALIKKLLTLHGIDLLKQMMLCLINTDDHFLRDKRGITIKTLRGEDMKLVQQIRGTNARRRISTDELSQYEGLVQR